MTEFSDASRRIETPSGTIAYVEAGIGPGRAVYPWRRPQ